MRVRIGESSIDFMVLYYSLLYRSKIDTDFVT